jgi:phosphate-selective porin
MKTRIISLVLVGSLFVGPKLFAFQLGGPTKTDTLTSQFDHTSEGFEFTSQDGLFQLQLAGRLQFRFATPNDQDPITYDDFDTELKNIFKVNRARLKIGGYAYQPWLQYYLEYELGSSQLLDFRVMVEKWPWLSFKVGQWKTEYTRERVISSGKQQMMERSIINRPFTLDRQQGVTVYGHLDGRGLADFNYYLAVLTGNGLGTSENDDKNLLYSGRFQWNLMGGGVEMSGSDLSYHEKPAVSLAWAGATNISQYTRFSSDGGGILKGYEEGEAGQYKVDQWLFESAVQYRSFSWHSEFHNKHIYDRVNLTKDTMVGGFVQGGYILNRQNAVEGHPLIEVAARYASYRPNLELIMNSEEEFSLAVNCFFNEHLNKLTADVTVFEFDQQSINREASGWRFRIQYDFSF